jgi:serralysin
MAALYVSPTGSGLRNGSSIENAAPLSSLNSLIAAAGPGGEVLLIADQGAYQQSVQVSITNGGTAGAPVTIRGIDSAGNPMTAEIVGSRDPNWAQGKAEGSELFRLLAGANNLVFEDLTIRNVGIGAFRVGADISNLTVRDMDAANVARFFDTLASGTATSASVDGLLIQNCNVTGFSRNAIRLQYDTRNVRIENVVGDGNGQSGGLFMSGVGISGTAHDIVLSHVTMKNSYGAGSPTEYWNGDGFSTELGNYNIRFEHTLASGNTDAGYDLKSSNTTLVHAAADGNNKNYRFWSKSITMTDSVSTDPRSYGGVGTTLHVWLAANAIASIDNLTFSDSGTPKTLIDMVQGGAVLTLTNTIIPPVYEPLVLVLNGTILTDANQAPTAITLSGGSVEENAGAGTMVGTLSAVDADAGDSHTFSIVGGAADQFEIAGGAIRVKAGCTLDYEAQSSYTLAIRTTDQRGLSFDSAVTVGLLDVKEWGGSGNDVLNGGAGADRLTGLAGNDTYTVNNSGDVIVEAANQGTDLVKAGIATYTLAANVENVTYVGTGDFVGTGNGLNNALTGGTGNDTLTGGYGNDVIRSGVGNDTVYGDDGRDEIRAGDGADQIFGGAQNDKMWGDSGDDTMYGGADSDYLYAWTGNDILDGGTGADQMYGCAGNDTFYVDSTGDLVVELAGEGTDAVLSIISYTLGAQVEKLGLLGGAAINGTGNSLANTLTGNSGANMLTGGAGDDVLDGGTGNDRLVGGEGADLYRFALGGGVDTLANFDTGGADKLAFGPGVGTDDLWFARSGNNLAVCVLGSTDKVVVENWYADARNHLSGIELDDGSRLNAAQVQSLVTAMSSIATPPASLDALTPAQHQTIENTITAAWQPAA